MATYRYYTCDLLTNTFQADLTLYGVYMDKQVSGAGNFNGTFRIGTGQPLETVMMGSTLPCKTALYVERNGQLIWGGIIWNRTYGSDGLTMQLSGQTFESYFNRCVFTSHVIQQGVEQVTLFKRLVDQMQAQAYSNMGFTFINQPNTGIVRTVLLPSYEFHFVQEAVDQLMQNDDAFEFTIEVNASGTTDQPNRQIRIGYPTLNSGATDLAFDYPGSLKKYYWPEGSALGGTKFASIGYGTGNQAPIAIVNNGTLLSNGYPAIWRVKNYANIVDRSLLLSKTKKDAKLFSIPVVRPTFTVNPDLGAGFTGWNELGAPCTVTLQDARFPTGRTASSRMLGWQLSLADTEQPEVTFVLENTDTL